MYAVADHFILKDYILARTVLDSWEPDRNRVVTVELVSDPLIPGVPVPIYM